MSIQLRLVIGFFLLTAGITGCVEKPVPESLAPRVSVEPAQQITRTAAVLTGKVEAQGSGTVSECEFRYGNTPDMSERIACETWEAPQVQLENLQPGTTYYFCLEAGNGHQATQSEVLQFQTDPNALPTVGAVSIVGQTPMSVILSCPLTDDGGETITEYGYLWGKEGEGESRESEAEWDEASGTFTLHLPDLEPLTAYHIQGFATNSLGRTCSEPLQFSTSNAISYLQPGSLPKLIHEKEKYAYTTLRIAAPLNGDDVRFLREMSGTTVTGEHTPGKIEVLNLGDSRIVSGGVNYSGSRFTANDTIGYGMFGNLPYLRELTLPQGAVYVENGAFGSASALERLVLPFKLKEITASDECPNLKEIYITPTNGYYKTLDGLLYNKSGRELVWYPQGKDSEELILSEQLDSIRSFALKGCKVKRVTIPESVTEVGISAFASSALEEVTFPQGLTHIRKGVLQECKQLRKVCLGKSTQYVGDYWIAHCPVKELYVYAEEPPFCSTDAFGYNESLFEQCILYVPAASLSRYKYHNTWKKFLQILPCPE